MSSNKNSIQISVNKTENTDLNKATAIGHNDHASAETHAAAANGDRQLDKNSTLEKHQMGFGTGAIHVGNKPHYWDMNQIVPCISLSTTYKQVRAGVPLKHDYARDGNPTRDVLEQSLAGLEGAKHGKVFSSGMSATSALVNLLKIGDSLICSDDVYGGTQRYLRRIGENHHGIKVDLVDLTNVKNLEPVLGPKTKMLWFESPSNPTLKVVDIQAVVETVKAYNSGIIVVVDNTFMSPYFQKPLSLGADVVFHSLTKYINGHTDVCMGAAITNDDKLAEHLHFMQKAIGAVPSAFDAYLVIRGIKTLHLRMRAHYDNGMAVARFLEADERVSKVLYPALPSHPQHSVHKKQTSGMSGMVTFYLKGGLAEAHKFLDAIKLFTLAESLGGYESLAELPAIMTHASVPEAERALLGISDNLIRLSVGIEDAADLINDLDQALAHAVSSPQKEQ